MSTRPKSSSAELASATTCQFFPAHGECWIPVPLPPPWPPSNGSADRHHRNEICGSAQVAWTLLSHKGSRDAFSSSYPKLWTTPYQCRATPDILCLHQSLFGQLFNVQSAPRPRPARQSGQFSPVKQVRNRERRCQLKAEIEEMSAFEINQYRRV